MNAIIHHAAPTVIAGVNFNADRFAEMFAWMSAMTADSVRALLLPNSYGLVMAYDGQPALGLQQIGQKIIVNRCAGITSSGSVIGVFADQTYTLDMTLPTDMHPAKQYQILVSIDVKNRQGFGKNAADMPERAAFTMPRYNLEVREVSADLGTAANLLPIGRLAFVTGAWQLQTYIPPCVHIGSSDLLYQKYVAFQQHLESLLESLPKVIRQTGAFNDRSRIELREFCVQLGSFFAQRRSPYRQLGKTGNPAKMLQLWFDFGSLANFLLLRLGEKARVDFYNYLSTATQGANGIVFNSHEFEAYFHALAHFDFQQTETLNAIQQVDKMLPRVVDLFKYLSTRVGTPLVRTPYESTPIPIEQQRPTNDDW